MTIEASSAFISIAAQTTPSANQRRRSPGVRVGAGAEVVGELVSAALMMDANNVVLLLNELEQAGYAARTRDATDRRRHNVELTAVGRRALERAEAGMDSIEADILAGLEDGERATLRALLSRAVEGAGPDGAVGC